MVPHFCNQFVTNVAFESEYRENTGNFLDTVIFYIVGSEEFWLYAVHTGYVV